MSTSKVSKIGNSFIETIIRFPLTFLIALAGTIVWLYIIETSSHNNDEAFKLLISLALGLPLSFAMYLMKEHQVFRFKRVLGELGVLLLVIVYYATLFNGSFDTEVVLVRYLVLTVAVHLLVAFSAYIKSTNQTHFWKFNQVLFVNILTSGFFTLTLYAGIALALFAIDQLFEVKINDKTYFKVFVVLSGIFNTLYFLSRTPRPEEDILTNHPYPKGLRVFAIYILVPLTVLYVCILYLYILKILINWELPDGGVAWLITIFSVAGLLTFLLIYPYRDDEENKWLKTYTRTFFWSMFPLVIMLFVSIFTRLAEYGFTENRYLILALAIWLLFISIYCLVTKSNKIKAIPVSLFVFCIISVVGPLSAFNISNISQKARFVEILERNNMFENDMIKVAADTVSGEDHSKMVGIIRYFFEKGQPDEILELYPKEVTDKLKKDGDIDKYISYYETEILVDAYAKRAVEYNEYDRIRLSTQNNKNIRRHFQISYQSTLNIAGYSKMDKVTMASPKTITTSKYKIDYPGNYRFVFNCEGTKFDFESDTNNLVSNTLLEFANTEMKNLGYKVIREPIEFSMDKGLINGDTLTLKLIIDNASFWHKEGDDNIEIQDISVWLLIKEE